MKAKGKVFIYSCKDAKGNGVDSEPPHLSVVYSGLASFLKENNKSFIPLRSYNLKDLLNSWGVTDELDTLKRDNKMLSSSFAQLNIFLLKRDKEIKKLKEKIKKLESK